MVVRKSHWKRVKGHLHLFIWQRKLLVTFTPWALLWSTWICPNAPSEVCHPTCFTTSQTWWLQVTFQCGFWIDTVICSPDMSHNYLCSLPMSLAHHPSLEVVRLAGNLFTRFPALLDTLPRQTSPTCLLVSLTSYTSVLPRLVHHDLLDLLLLAEAGDGDGGVEAGHQQDTVDNVSFTNTGSCDQWPWPLSLCLFRCYNPWSGGNTCCHLFKVTFGLQVWVSNDFYFQELTVGEDQN